MTDPAILDCFALFHLNLAFSSVEEDQRADVVQRCYWPLLVLAETHGPIGIEATGFTLEEIEMRDPRWIERFAALSGAEVPAGLRARLRAAAGDPAEVRRIGVAAATELWCPRAWLRSISL